MKRTAKKSILRLVNPFDYLVRWANHKQDLPPFDLRWDVGPLRTFESSGAEFLAYLKLFMRLKPNCRVLDIGCGCGQIALQLREAFDEDGRYVGCDINRRAIDWCQKSIARRDGRFSFYHMDVKNGLYNPAGSLSASDFVFPKSEKLFDVILLKSVFTHMLKDEVSNYLHQIPSLLSPGGKCLASFFLLNARQQELAVKNKNMISFKSNNYGSYVRNQDMPEGAVAYSESDVLEMLRLAGLKRARPIEYGNWTGDKSGLSHQDLIVVERSDEH